MSAERHGADSFEILSFVRGFGSNKVYNVRHKETGEHLTMHVITKENQQPSSLDSALHTRTLRIPFLTSLRYTFQTRSRNYLVLDSIESERQLSKLYNSFGPFHLQEVIFLAAEIITAITHLHVCCTTYRQLSLENVLIDVTGHVQLKRDIFDSSQWAQRECFLCLGKRLCDYHSTAKVDQSSVAKDWEDIGNLVCLLLTGKRAFKDEDWLEDRIQAYERGPFPPYSLPASLPAVAADFIEGLLQWRETPLPASLTQQHRLFDSVDWQKVAKRQLTPPPRFSKGIPKSPPKNQASLSGQDDIPFKLTNVASDSSKIPVVRKYPQKSELANDALNNNKYQSCSNGIDGNFKQRNSNQADVDYNDYGELLDHVNTDNTVLNGQGFSYVQGIENAPLNTNNAPGDLENLTSNCIPVSDTSSETDFSNFENKRLAPECPDDVAFVTAESLDHAWRRRSTESSLSHDEPLNMPSKYDSDNYRVSENRSCDNSLSNLKANDRIRNQYPDISANRGIAYSNELLTTFNESSYSSCPLNSARSQSYYEADNKLLNDRATSHRSEISPGNGSEIDEGDYERMTRVRSSSLYDQNNPYRNYAEFNHAEIYEQQALDSRPKLEAHSTPLRPEFARSRSYNGGFLKSRDSYCEQFIDSSNLTTLERARRLLDANFGNWRDKQKPSLERESSEQHLANTSSEEIRTSVEKAKSLHKRLSQSLQNIRTLDTNMSRIPQRIQSKSSRGSSANYEPKDTRPFSFSAGSNEDVDNYVEEYLNMTWPAKDNVEDERDSLKKTWPIFVSGGHVDSRYNQRSESDKRNSSLMQKISDCDALQKIKQGAYLQGNKNFSIPVGNRPYSGSHTQDYKSRPLGENRRILKISSKSFDESFSSNTLRSDDANISCNGKLNKIRDTSSEQPKLLLQQNYVSPNPSENSLNRRNSLPNSTLPKKQSAQPLPAALDICKNDVREQAFNSTTGLESPAKQAYDSGSFESMNLTASKSRPLYSFDMYGSESNHSPTSDISTAVSSPLDGKTTTSHHRIVEENIVSVHKHEEFKTPDYSLDLEDCSDSFNNHDKNSTAKKGNLSRKNSIPRLAKTTKPQSKAGRNVTSAEKKDVKPPANPSKIPHVSTGRTDKNSQRQNSQEKKKQRPRLGVRRALSVESVLSDISSIDIDDNEVNSAHTPLLISQCGSINHTSKHLNTDSEGIHDNVLADKPFINPNEQAVKNKGDRGSTSSCSKEPITPVPSKIPVSRKSLSTGAISVRKDTVQQAKASDTKMRVLLSPRGHKKVSKNLKESESDVKSDLKYISNEENTIPSSFNVKNVIPTSPTIVDPVDLVDRLRVLSDGSRSGRNSPTTERRFSMKDPDDLDRMNSVRKILQPLIVVEKPTPMQAPSSNLQVNNMMANPREDIVSRESSIGSASDLWMEEEEKRCARLKRKYCRRSSSGNSGKSNDSFEEMSPRQMNVISPTLTINSSEDDISIQTRDMDRTSFHSGKSVDSGLSDIFESSREDLYNSSDSTTRGKVVAKSDSGVMKDIDEIRMCHSEDNVFEEITEHEARKTEALIKCNFCQKGFVPDGELSKNYAESICSRCRSKKVERKEAIVELIQTEINYGQDLRILKEEFYTPIKNGGILSPENFTAVFLNLQELIDVNSKLCITLQGDLEECISKSDQELTSLDVGRVFLDNVEFFQAYEIFCAKQRQALELVENLKKKSELLRIFLQVSCKQNSKLRKMDLKSFLAMPVQRIMKYPLLLTRIYRATQRGNPDREALLSARRKIEEQIGRINEIAIGRPAKLRKCKSTSALNQPDSAGNHLKKLTAEILNWKQEETLIIMSGSLEVSCSELIGQGSWSRKSVRKQSSVQAILCAQGVVEHMNWSIDNGLDESEIGLPAKSEITDAAVILLRRKSTNRYALFKEPILLRQAVIAHRSDVAVAFEICPMLKEPFTFLVQDQIACGNWLRNLNHFAKHQGAWRRRRNAMANIMIKSMS